MTSSIGMIAFYGLFLGMMWFLLIRPQNKKKKQLEAMRSELAKGDKVTTIGGIVGTVLNVKEDEVVVEVGADRTNLTFKTWAIGSKE